MRIRLPQAVQKIINTLTDAGFEAFVVGGCVRDTLLGRLPEDWDITTSAPPLQVKRLFDRTVDTGLKHGTVTVLLEGTGYEVTTYRIDGEYSDARHPREVTFTSDLREDLRRRDFTINAMAYNEQRGLVDAFEGRDDLEKGRIRCVGDPVERFSEDALRMLRAVRFAAQLDFEIEERTAEAIRQLAPTIAKVSAERIQAELVKLLLSPHPQKLRIAWQLGLTGVFLPEFDRMMEQSQNTPHHCCSVGEHTLRSVAYARSDRILRLTMLLHDVAKPLCVHTDGEGRDHFHGHPEAGAELAGQILRRLRFDNETTRLVCALIRWHDDRPEPSMRNIRRALNRIGPEVYPLLLEVKEADIMAQSEYRRQEKREKLMDYRLLYKRILEEKQCVTRAGLAVNGADLIRELDLDQGKAVGQLLDALLEQVIDHPEDNSRERLLELARDLRTDSVHEKKTKE